MSSIFYMVRDIDPKTLKLHEKEVDEVLWMPLKDCKAMVRDNTMKHCIYMEELDMLPETL